MPIGGVLTADGVIIPNAVGVDIGCGMLAAQTTLRHGIDTSTLKLVMSRVREAVPVGFAHHQDAQSLLRWRPDGPITDEHAQAAAHQIGTLGGGNHFIEFQHDSNGCIWFMIHSGSRNLGLKVANHYNAVAKALNAAWRSDVPPSWDLAFLPADSAEGQAYIAEMQSCVEFAQQNRCSMAERIEGVVREVTGATVARIEHIAHNYAAIEHHFRRNVWVHRKGATRARKDEVGIIPGSQGTHSYIVRGLGNPESFESCSHGAGRKMGRKEACRSLDLQAEIAALDAKGIVHSVRHVQDLEEATGAYKDIDEVMANQTDLVSIEVELTPLGVIKDKHATQRQSPASPYAACR
jgi:tRNA-splicing ligase RtcB